MAWSPRAPAQVAARRRGQCIMLRARRFSRSDQPSAMPSKPSLMRRAPAWAAAVPVLAVAAVVAGVAVLARDAPRVEPRAVTPRGPLPPAEQALVGLFPDAAPSVASLPTEIRQPPGFL